MLIPRRGLVTLPILPIARLRYAICFEVHDRDGVAVMADRRDMINDGAGDLPLIAARRQEALIVTTFWPARRYGRLLPCHMRADILGQQIAASAAR